MIHLFKLIICLQFFAEGINTREQKNCLYRRCQIKWFALSISLIYTTRLIIYIPKKCRVSSSYARYSARPRINKSFDWKRIY